MANVDDLTAMARTLCQLPRRQLDLLAGSPVMLQLCHHSVTEGRPSLKGRIVTPIAMSPSGSLQNALRYWDDQQVAWFPSSSPPQLLVAMQPVVGALGGASWAGHPMQPPQALGGALDTVAEWAWLRQEQPADDAGPETTTAAIVHAEPA